MENDSDVMDRPRTSLRNMFIPVIFANGEDDDTPGLVAAFERKPVLFDNLVRGPDDDVTIIRRKLVMTKGIYVTGEGIPIPPLADNVVVAVQREGRRFVTIMDCHIEFRS